VPSPFGEALDPGRSQGSDGFEVPHGRPPGMRRGTAYLPAIIAELVGAAMFGALVAGFNPDCQCIGVCGCPAEVGPPFPLLTLVVFGCAGLLAAGTYFGRHRGKGASSG